jgi:hypothetical protein
MVELKQHFFHRAGACVGGKQIKRCTAIEARLGFAQPTCGLVSSPKTSSASDAMRNEGPRE